MLFLAGFLEHLQKGFLSIFFVCFIFNVSLRSAPKRKNFDIQRNTRVGSGGQFTSNRLSCHLIVQALSITLPRPSLNFFDHGTLFGAFHEKQHINKNFTGQSPSSRHLFKQFFDILKLSNLDNNTFISTEGALIRPLTYDNHLIHPYIPIPSTYSIEDDLS